MYRNQKRVFLISALLLFSLLLSVSVFTPPAQATGEKVEVEVDRPLYAIWMDEELMLTSSCEQCDFFLCHACSDDVTWEWQVVQSPPDANYDFLDVDTPTPIFTSHTKGCYSINVIVRYGEDVSEDSTQICTWDPIYWFNLSHKWPVVIYDPPLVGFDKFALCGLDEDANGLSDMAEQEIAEHFVPYFAFDAGEPCWSLNPDEPHTIYNIRLDSVTEDELHLVIRYGMVWQDDGGFVNDKVCWAYGPDYHYGDTQPMSVGVKLRKEGAGKANWIAELEWIIGFTDDDRHFYSHSEPPMHRDGTHPIVYPTAGKHHFRPYPGEYKCCGCDENALGNLTPWRLPTPEHVPQFWPAYTEFPTATGPGWGPPFFLFDGTWKWVNACSLLQGDPQYRETNNLRRADFGDWLANSCPIGHYEEGCCEHLVYYPVPYDPNAPWDPTNYNFIVNPFFFSTDGIYTLVMNGFNLDVDGDGRPFWDDPCPVSPDNTTDCDRDGICDQLDVCPYDPNNDADGDGFCDVPPMTVTPSEGFQSAGPQGGPFKQWFIYRLKNTSCLPIYWTAKHIQQWVELSPYPPFGTLAGYDSADVVVSFNNNAKSLEPGTHADMVLFTGGGQGTISRLVTLEVKTPGVLDVMTAGGLKSSGPEGGPSFNPSSKDYWLQNTGGWPISWMASQTLILHPWVTLSATSGTLEPNTHPTKVTVSINSNANGLPQEGSPYKDKVSFTNTTNGKGNTTRVVNLTVTPPGILSVGPADGLTSTGPEGGLFSPSSKAYTLENTGGSPIDWTTSKTQTWTRLSKTSGVLGAHKSTTVTVFINNNAKDLPQEGSYYKDTVSFTNETNGKGNTTRVVYLTVNAPTVLLTIPNGGDVLPSGGAYAICWKTSSKAVKFDLLYTTNGTDWTAIKTVTGLSCISWEVPVVTKNEKQCRVKVIGYDSNGVKIGEGTSDKPFTIEVLRITSPNGGEVLKSGSTWNIGWKSFETIRPVAKTVLKITTNPLGTRWNAIKTLTGNPGNYSWKVPNVSSKQCKVKVVLQDAGGVNVGTDVSDKFFTIQP
jgi:hypothetical protein